MPTTYTPIRYPGGKSKLFPVVDSVIEASVLSGCTYAEAFCGGAGLAVKLLLGGRVSRLVLNDLDPAVYSMWDAIVRHPDETCEFLSEVNVTLDEWRRQRDVFLSTDSPSLELGKAALFLNRTNRSGILRGGPIGGKGQAGAYKIDARFNAKTLCAKVRAIAERRLDIELHNLDANVFIDEVLKPYDGSLFTNFDPPYVEKGPELYANSFREEDHVRLAKRISACEFPWIVTYDAVALVDEAYGAFSRYDVALGYSVATVREGSEILVAGPGVVIPEGLLGVRGLAA